ncbi:MAG TPA: glucokinase [Spongiibacteraceae bacterium]
MESKALALIGDIGGTHCRFALARDGQLLRETITIYDSNAYLSIVDAANAFFKTQQAHIDIACLAIAAPVGGDAVHLTNNPWQFSIKQTQHDLGLSVLSIINDFEAIGLALPHLRAEQLQQIGGAEPQPKKPKAALGPGTGYGATHVINCGGNIVALPTEGGHVSLAPSTQQELELFEWLLQHRLQITCEQLISGPGLERLHGALCDLNGVTCEKLSAAQIQQRASTSEDPLCVAALNLFCELLGTAARDQALCCLAQGGVYIAGGIVKRFIPFLRASGFRKRFENSDTMRALLEPIPVFVIVEENPGLIGAAAHTTVLRLRG